jgi:hypothetical protein
MLAAADLPLVPALSGETSAVGGALPAAKVEVAARADGEDDLVRADAHPERERVLLALVRDTDVRGCWLSVAGQPRARLPRTVAA